MAVIAMTTMTSMPSLTQNPYHNANYENKYFNKTNIYIYQCWNKYSNDSNIRIKVSESLDSDSDSGLLQILNKIRIFELKVSNIPNLLNLFIYLENVVYR